MNEYNERTLQNVLQDYREENDEELLREIEEAANDPLYQNREGEAEAFVKANTTKSKKKVRKILFRAASVILVFVLSFAAVTVTVEGFREKIIQFFANFVNSDYIAIDSSEDDELLLTFEGQYVPSWIPTGYKISSVSNAAEKKEIVFTNSDGNMITYKEQITDVKSKIDSEECDDAENIEVNGLKGIYVEKEGIKRVALATENSILYITSDDPEIDLIGFAELIEKR